MKVKNIIPAILMILSFVACTSEIEGIDNMTNNNANNSTTSISVRMITDGMNTKSGSSDELTIKNYAIAVFEVASGQRIGYLAENNTPSTTTISIDTKKVVVNVIAVANVDDVSEFDSLYTYEEFKSKTVGSLANFTKVGIKENVTLDVSVLEITLKQLTARVNVTLNKPTVVGGDNVTVKFKAYSFNATIKETSNIIAEPQSVVATEKSLENEGATSFSYYTYAVANPTLIVKTKLEVYVNEELKKSVDRDITVAFISLRGENVIAAGESYNQTINATVTITQNYDVNFEYEVVKIKNNEDQVINYK